MLGIKGHIFRLSLLSIVQSSFWDPSYSEIDCIHMRSSIESPVGKYLMFGIRLYTVEKVLIARIIRVKVEIS